MCVRDGWGRGCNGFAGRVLQLSQKWSAISFFLIIIVKAAAGLDTLRCRLRERCHCGCLLCTIDGQEHKIIRRAGPERDTNFHLPVTACRKQGSHCRDERLARVASRGQGAPAHSSRKSWERTARELTTLILWLINSPCELTGSNL